MSPRRSALVLALGGVLVVSCGGATGSGPDDGAKGGATNGGGGGANSTGGEAVTHSGGTSGGSGTTGGLGGNAGSGGRRTGGTRAGSGGSGADATGGSFASGGAQSGGAGGTSAGGNAGTAGMVNTGGASAGNSSGGTSGGSGGGEAGSAGQTSIQCSGAAPYFPKFDRTCVNAVDCVAVAHQTNCCGARLVTGIRASAQAAFEAAEAICEQQYPLCGCAAFGTDVEDGTRVDFAWQDQVEVVCDAGSCKAKYSGTSFACGASLRCTEQQYCVQSSGGPAGTPTSYSCNPTTCADCSCITQPACSCALVDGHVMVTCLRA